MLDSCDTLRKRFTGVAFVFNEEEEFVSSVNQSENKRKSKDGECRKIATSTGDLTTEIGLSLAIRDSQPRPSRFVVYQFGRKFLGAELPPRREVVAHENFLSEVIFTRVSQPKLSRKNFFELNRATVSDSGHTTTSWSADQLIQFVHAVGAEVTLASYGLLEGLLVWSHGVSTIGQRG